MADRPGPPGWTHAEAVVARAERRWDADVGVQLLHRLTGADYLSLAALFFAWSSAVALLVGAVNRGVLLMVGAFVLDKADGYYARKRGVASSFGRQIDSFVDAFAYLLTAALLYHAALSPTPVLTVVVGFAVLAFGGLRLVRHASEGFGEAEGASYYVGLTVVHANFVVLGNYYLQLFVPWWNGWLATVPILAVCPLLVSGYRSYKTTLGHALAGTAAALAAGTSLWIEFGRAGVIA